jgi:hypothetical protein
VQPDNNIHVSSNHLTIKSFSALEWLAKLEKRTDMYISTLRNFIKAMGGDLETIATFPDGSVQISQFENIAAKTERGNSPSSG